MKLITCILLFLASSAFAQSTPLVLNTMVTDQNGTYQIIEEGEAVPFSGAAIQVFAPGERVLLDGTRLPFTFVFGQMYLQDGTFFVFQGMQQSTEIPNFIAVLVATISIVDDAPLATVVGEGALYFDEERAGNAKDLRLSVWFYEEGPFVIYEYNLTAQSDRLVFGCQLAIQFSPPNPQLYFCPQ